MTILAVMWFRMKFADWSVTVRRTCWAVTALAAGAVLCRWSLLRLPSPERPAAEDDREDPSPAPGARSEAGIESAGSERRFRLVVEAAPNAIVVVDGKGAIVLVNVQAEQVFGYHRNELLGRSVEMLVPKRFRDGHPGHRAGFFSTPSTRPMGEGRDLFALRKDGSEFPVEIGLNPMETEDGTLVLSAIVDITARKAAQVQIETALREKTALLKEIHHRVKNNLQVVSSLLNLQARHASPEVRQALMESQERLRAMALMHQLLYERQDFHRIHLGEYLERLGRLMLNFFGAERGQVSLQILGTQEPVYLDMARAIPWGLLVNELTTNAFKHAFPDKQRGTVRVALALEGEEALLTVADDGVGLPAEVEPGGTKSLGFQLLPLFVDQMKAHLSIHRDNGTRFELRFKIEGGPP